MEQEKKIIFEYSANSVTITPDTINTKYVVYDDGYIEKQILDSDEEFVIQRIKCGKNKHAVIVINEFYTLHKNIIDSIPSELDNSEVCDGSFVFIRFLNKTISGFNIIYPITPNAKEYDDVNKFQTLLGEFVKTLKQYSYLKKLEKVILEKFHD